MKMARGVVLVAILCGSWGCGDDGGGGAPDAAPDPDAAAGPTFVVEPSIVLGPNANAPLAALLTLETDRPTTVTVSLDDGVDIEELVLGSLDTSHSLTVLGFRPELEYTIGVTVADAGGLSLVLETPLEVTAPALPDDFPVIEAVVTEPASMEPGVTMFATGAADGSYLIMVDAAGDVVWYLSHPNGVSDVRRLGNGNLLFTTGDRLGAVEVDMLGNIVQTWHAANSTDVADSTAVATDSFHHELFAMDSGNFVVVSSEQRLIDGFPTSVEDLTPRVDPVDVVGDVLVEFQRDGTIVGSWSLLDMLDPTRVGYDSFGTFWNAFYETSAFDWSHANAIIHDPSDDSFITSLRHQDAVVKFDRLGELVWILGPHENWGAPWDQYLLTPTDGSFIFQYHQHAPEITPNDTLLMFDNGVSRASPPDPKTDTPYSRALEVEIDPVNMEVTEVWSYDADQLIFAPIVGDADWMPETGNVLIDFGGILPGNSVDPSAIIVEVTHASPAVEVFRLEIADNNPSGATIVYRAERLPLYP